MFFVKFCIGAAPAVIPLPQVEPGIGELLHPPADVHILHFTVMSGNMTIIATPPTLNNHTCNDDDEYEELTSKQSVEDAEQKTTLCATRSRLTRRAT